MNTAETENTDEMEEAGTSSIEEAYIPDREVEKRKSLTDVLGKGTYQHAKMKNIKIYSEQEIESSKSELEKKRRIFWNEKAEQLSKSQMTYSLPKTTLIGIIDVSWTLRKTALIEGEARKILDDEQLLSSNDDVAVRKLGSQKKETIPKNLDRMAAAQLAVENLDKEIEKCQEAFKGAISLAEKGKHTQRYKQIKC
ncbi:hypothetical protein OS493_024305 [Desmophyllum pertusum]|uniref:Uncharacterized protein n=1 Tax=Desmophyllum pertusum TaxID=174260 RepID=A0A9W9YY01_9CNID|nr:hypothetical protein OS493_024305 [Desmophyllum pertusum]